MVVRSDPVGDSDDGPPETVPGDERRGGCGQSSALRTGHRHHCAALRLAHSAAALSARHLRFDVRMLETPAGRETVFPRDPPVPSTQKPRLFAHLTAIVHRLCRPSANRKTLHVLIARWRRVLCWTEHVVNRNLVNKHTLPHSISSAFSLTTHFSV